MLGTQKRIFFTSVYLFGLLAYNFVQQRGPSEITIEQIGRNDSDTFKYQILEERSAFIDAYYKVPDFLTTYFKHKTLAQVNNTTSQSLVVDFSNAFYTFSRIESELGRVDKTHSGALKLFAYFADRYVYTSSQYYHKFGRMDYVPYFFSVSSSGYCSYAAVNFVNLAQYYGFLARVVGLEGHVVAEIYYQNGWHMFDPSYAKYILNDYGTVASVQEVNMLAKKTFFSDSYYSKAFSSKSEPRYPEKILASKVNQGYSLLLHPNEKVFFYEDLWMLTTDGVAVEQISDEKSFISEHSVKVANFVREIPLSSLNEEMKQYIEIDGVFPLSGAYIYLPNHVNKNSFVKKNLPLVLIQTAKLIPNNQYYGTPTRYYQIRTHTYLSLSEFILNLEDVYSTKISIKNIGNVLRISPEAKLVLLYQYVPAHVKWNELEIEGKKKQIEVHINAR